MKNNDDLKVLLASLSSGMSAEDLQLSVLQGLIAGEISMRRQSLHLSQTELAERLGVSQGLVSRWESGDANFNLSTLVKIASALNLRMQSPFIPMSPIAYPTGYSNIIHLNTLDSWQTKTYQPAAPSRFSSEFENERQEM